MKEALKMLITNQSNIDKNKSPIESFNQFVEESELIKNVDSYFDPVENYQGNLTYSELPDCVIE